MLAYTDFYYARSVIAFRILSPLLKIFFYLLYHHFAWTYDWVASFVSVGMWKEWVLAVVPHIKGPRVLELGHGPGHLQAALLLDKGIWACGIDASDQMGKQAYNHLRTKGYFPRLIRGLAQRLPFQDDSFHQVVATFPTEFILDPQTLDETYRVLRPGGCLIMLPIAWITGKRRLDRAAAWLFRVTRQSPKWDDRVLEPARRMGFYLEVDQYNLEFSTILIIRAQKPIQEPSRV